jgi:hypothetical protein
MNAVTTSAKRRSLAEHGRRLIRPSHIAARNESIAVPVPSWHQPEETGMEE